VKSVSTLILHLTILFEVDTGRAIFMSTAAVGEANDI